MCFAVLYGAANGMMTIVRALLPAELFGREDYGAIQGMIAMPVRLASRQLPSRSASCGHGGAIIGRGSALSS